MRIAALMKSADISATEESMVAKRIASALLLSVSTYRRVCTIDECRYRLCGITVAPRMLMAMYNIAGSVRICPRGMKPAATSPMFGLAHKISIANEPAIATMSARSEEHTSELQSLRHLVCRLL